MMTAILLDVICAIAGFLLTAIPSIFIINDLVKKRKAAKTNEEKLEAEKELQAQKKIFIEETEALYNSLAPTLKSAGLPVNQLKKDSTMSKLRMYAITKNLPYDEEFYSKEVDDDITHTKKVNYQEKTTKTL